MEEMLCIRPTLEQMFVATTPMVMFCADCSKQFFNRSSYRMHMEKTHKTTLENNKISHNFGHPLSLGTSLGARYFCPHEKCSRANHSFPNPKSLIQHFQKAHHEKRFKCPDCPARFSLKRDLDYHSKKKCSARSTNKHSYMAKRLAPTLTTDPAATTISDLPKLGVIKKFVLLFPTDQQLEVRRPATGRRLIPIACRRANKTCSVSTQTDSSQPLLTTETVPPFVCRCCKCFVPQLPLSRSAHEGVGVSTESSQAVITSSGSAFPCCHCWMGSTSCNLCCQDANNNSGNQNFHRCQNYHFRPCHCPNNEPVLVPCCHHQKPLSQQQQTLSTTPSQSSSSMEQLPGPSLAQVQGSSGPPFLFHHSSTAFNPHQPHHQQQQFLPPKYLVNSACQVSLTPAQLVMPAITHRKKQPGETPTLGNPTTTEAMLINAFSQTICPERVDFGMITDNIVLYEHEHENSNNDNNNIIGARNDGEGDLLGLPTSSELTVEFQRGENSIFAESDFFSSQQRHCETQTPLSYFNDLWNEPDGFFYCSDNGKNNSVDS